MTRFWRPHQITDESHRKLLHRFATWHALRHLRDAASKGVLMVDGQMIDAPLIRQARAILASVRWPVPSRLA